ncbi:MAG: hypothetical protein OD814_000381 [Candidatus Alkanophagales archaeon MCA70_species_1]|nr:hypothetical protein [Candidatus Alkanophaga volatiphilum]
MQVRIGVADHALEFAESMKNLHLILWLLPAKDLKGIIDYLTQKGLKFDRSLSKSDFASYETIWRSVVEQLGLKRALWLCFSEFVRRHDAERVRRVLELLRAAESRSLSDAEVGELAALGATPFVTANRLNELGKLALMSIAVEEPPSPSEPAMQPGRALERTVAEALRELGFEAKTNEVRPSRVGSPVECDVWAWKGVTGGRLSVYVSCKDWWNKAVDRRVIDEEFGRTQNLKEVPQLKADGFFVIELGDRDLDEMREFIRRALRELFTAIAPPALQRLASETKELAERLRSIAGELERLAAD